MGTFGHTLDVYPLAVENIQQGHRVEAITRRAEQARGDPAEFSEP